MKLNDENLPEEIRPKDKDQAVKPLEPEQKNYNLSSSFELSAYKIACIE